MHFQKLRELRNEFNLTQQNLADMLHCQREVYRRYETGIRDIPVSYAIALAKYYNVSIDFLLGETDKRERY